MFRGFPKNVTDKNDAKWSRPRFQQRLAVLKGAKNGGVVTRNARQTGQNMDNAEPSHYNVPRMGDGHELY